MNIIIAGDGEVGLYLAKALVDGNHNITIVDPHEELLKMIESHTDLMTITGDSTSVKVLQQAQVSKADLVLSVLHEEKTNLMTAILAKKLGAKKVIARVNTLESIPSEVIEIYKELGVDDMISPEDIAAEEIIDLLQQSAATEVFEFSGGQLSMFLIKLEEHAPVVNKTLNQIAREKGHLDYRAVAIHRGHETFIPRGESKLLTNDLCYVISKTEAVDDLMRLGGKNKVPIRDVMIIGGGRVGRTAAHRLEKNMNIKLVEYNKDRCLFLTDYLEETLIINGDARDIELLESEDIASMDAFISVTDSSETNIITCLHAKKYGVKKAIALVENLDYIGISQNIGIDTIINKKLIAASHMVKYTMSDDLTTLRCLSGIDADVMEYRVKTGSLITKKPIKDLKIPEGAIIGGIMRGNESHIATGDFHIQPDDRVVLFALPHAVQKVQKFF